MSKPVIVVFVTMVTIMVTKSVDTLGSEKTSNVIKKINDEVFSNVGEEIEILLRRAKMLIQGVIVNLKLQLVLQQIKAGTATDQQLLGLKDEMDSIVNQIKEIISIEKDLQEKAHILFGYVDQVKEYIDQDLKGQVL